MEKSAPQDKNTITVRYNHRDVTLDSEQAKKFAQIGMKFQKIAEMLKIPASIKGEPIAQLVQSIADEQTTKLREKYNDISDDEFQNLLELYKEKAKVDEEIDEEKEFASIFPQIPIKSLPQEVYDLALSRKISITDAYLRYLQKGGMLCNDYLSAFENQRKNALGSMKTGDCNDSSNAVTAMLQGLKK